MSASILRLINSISSSRSMPLTNIIALVTTHRAPTQNNQSSFLNWGCL
jgi:hypothetical protein